MAQRDFDALVHAFGRDLYRYALALCRDEHAAEDLVQETFLRAWRGFDGLRDLGSAKFWLLTTLRREHYRRFPQAGVQSLDAADIETESIATQALDRDAAIDIARLLASLPDAYREALVLQLLFGYSTQEVAGLMGLTESAVANRLLRARKLLLRTGAGLAAVRNTA